MQLLRRVLLSLMTASIATPSLAIKDSVNPWSFPCIEQGMHLPRGQINTKLELVISDHPVSFPRLLVDLVFSNVCFACRLGFEAFESFLLANCALLDFSASAASF